MVGRNTSKVSYRRRWAHYRQSFDAKPAARELTDIHAWARLTTSSIALRLLLVALRADGQTIMLPIRVTFCNYIETGVAHEHMVDSLYAYMICSSVLSTGEPRQDQPVPVGRKPIELVCLFYNFRGVSTLDFARRVVTNALSLQDDPIPHHGPSEGQRIEENNQLQ